uniref:HTH cro/C1-type domain-containing protein n=1 Tax=Florenciella parvula TaxID=236787 RepID=A0A7S2B4X5_9STRA|mmetsp:Transcript_13174/g.27859  ORF Transcript_13174/g.27859 Transcript_13174/m.27859 type:complete len:149 (+) Transcript_13174:447-893(+)
MSCILLCSSDWEPVVLRKSGGGRSGGGRGAGGGGRGSGGGGQMERKMGGANSSVNSLGAGAAKLDRETDELKHRTVDKSLSKAIMQARLAKKMNQKQLGTAINEKPQVIQQYEAGKAIPNPQVISKLERALGCRLPRPKKAKKVKDDE